MISIDHNYLKLLNNPSYPWKLNEWIWVLIYFPICHYNDTKSNLRSCKICSKLFCLHADFLKVPQIVAHYSVLSVYRTKVVWQPSLVTNLSRTIIGQNDRSRSCRVDHVRRNCWMSPLSVLECLSWTFWTFVYFESFCRFRDNIIYTHLVCPQVVCKIHDPFNQQTNHDACACKSY